MLLRWQATEAMEESGTSDAGVQRLAGIGIASNYTYQPECSEHAALLPRHTCCSQADTSGNEIMPGEA